MNNILLGKNSYGNYILINETPFNQIKFIKLEAHVAELGKESYIKNIIEMSFTQAQSSVIIDEPIPEYIIILEIDYTKNVGAIIIDDIGIIHVKGNEPDEDSAFNTAMGMAKIIKMSSDNVKSENENNLSFNIIRK